MPIIQGGANAVMNNYTANQGNLKAISGQINSMLPKLGNMALDTKALQPGQSYANDVLGGKYLDSNPYTQSMAHQAGQDALNAVNSSFSLAGRTGGGNNYERAAQGVANAENNVLFQNYQNERGLQSQAASMLPGYQQAKFAGMTPYLGAAQLAGQLPYYGSQSLGTIGNILGGYGTSTSSGTKPGGWGNDILNAGMAALPFVLSDRRLKKNIVKLGEASDGLGIYEFVYKFDPNETINRGVMADEVEKLRPWAFVANFRGDYAGVNYGALGSLA